jgi:hypothetical protein
MNDRAFSYVLLTMVAICAIVAVPGPVSRYVSAGVGPHATDDMGAYSTTRVNNFEATGTANISGLVTATSGGTTPANWTTTGTGDLVSADDLTVGGDSAIGNDPTDLATVTGTIDSDAATTLVGDFRGKVLEVGSVSGTVNDWAPAGHETATHIFITPTATMTINGLAGGADGRVVTITNTAASTIQLSNESAGSLAANRFTMGASGTWIIGANESLSFVYSGTSSRWRHLATRRFPSVYTDGSSTLSGTTSMASIGTAGIYSLKAIGTTFDSSTGATYYSNFEAYDNTALAAGTGGAITFSALTEAAVKSYGAAIKAMKANATSTNTEFDLVFGARANGEGDVAEACRILGASKTFNCIGGLSTDGNLTATGKIAVTGTDPTVSACGTTPAIVGNDTAGIITAGSGTATACTITFASTYTDEPVCVVTSHFNSGDPLYFSAKSATAFTVTTASGANFASTQINYVCFKR